MNVTISNNHYANEIIQPILSSSIVRTVATNSNSALITLIQSTANVAACVFLIIKVITLFPVTAIAIPDLIGNRIYEANSYLLGLTLIPFTISKIGFDYIEDIVIRTNQKILDILHIQISLPVSHLKLKNTLKKWENENGLQLNYREASQRILSFSNGLRWEPFQELSSSINNCLAQSPQNFRLFFDVCIFFLFQNYPNLSSMESPSIDLRNLELQSLPPIFHYKNYKDFSLNLDNNQLNTLPESIFSVPSRCRISIENNNFSNEYLLSLRMRKNKPDYSGPKIDCQYFHDFEKNRIF